MTSALRPAVASSPPAKRTRTSTRALASACLGGLAGLVAATLLVALAPPVGRGAVDGAAAAAPFRDTAGRRREPALPPVASVLMPAMAAGAIPPPDSAQARP